MFEHIKEIWIWRRMLKSVGKTNTNACILEKVKDERCMLNTVWQQKQRWLGHVLRNEG